MRKRQPTLRLVAVDGVVFSAGYKSGRNSERETPESCSSGSTRSGGMPLWRHLWTACGEIPNDRASASAPPDALRARVNASACMTATKPQVDLRVNLRSVAVLNQGFHAFAMSPLGRVITSALRHQDRTQEWLAHQIGVSENAVSKWIKTGKISRVNAVHVADKLNLPLEHVLRPSSAGGTDGVNPLDSRWRELKPDVKAKVFELIDSLGLDTSVQSPPAPTRPAATRHKARKVS
jgi:hypothetical protein